MRALALILMALLPLGARAQSLEKRNARRAEAEGLVRQIQAGTSVQPSVSRLKFLGEEEYATQALAAHISDVDVRRRRAVAQALAHLAAPTAEPAHVRLTRDEDAAVRMSAAEGLGRLRSRNVAALRPLLSDPTLGVRREAARAMGLGRAPRAVEPLLAAVQVEGEPEVRAALLVALGQCGEKEAIPVMERSLQSSSESTRLAAARGLCLLGAPSGRDFARKLLASKDRDERRQAVALFEGASARVARPQLEPALKDADPAVAAAAARILYQGGDAAMLDWLVLASFRAGSSDERLAYEAELEPLHLADDQRKAILMREGFLE